MASTLPKVAAALCIMSSARLARIESQLLRAVPRRQLVHYVEAVQYDETPMKTRLPGMSDLMSRASASAARAGGVPVESVALQVWGRGESSALAHQHRPVAMPRASASVGVQKLLQTKGEVGAVVQIADKMVTLTFEPEYPLQVLESTIAAVLKAAQERISPVGQAAVAFRHCTRAVTTDAYSGNIAAEQAIARCRGASCSPLHLLCATHATAGVYDKVFSLVDNHITGVIRVAIALRNGPSMDRFRMCMRDEIASRLEILRGGRR